MKSWFARTAYKYSVFFSHNVREIRKRKVSYCLGFLSVFMVVLVVAASVTVLMDVPAVFFRLAEIDQGQIDMKIQPSDAVTDALAVRYTLVSKILSTVGSNPVDYRNNAPRILQSSLRVFSEKFCVERGYAAYATDVGQRYADAADPAVGFCGSGPTNDFDGSIPRTDFYAIDSEKESEMGLGSRWDLPSVPPGSTYIGSGLATQLDLRVGDFVYAVVTFDETLRGLYTEWSGGGNTSSLSSRVHEDRRQMPLMSAADAAAVRSDPWLRVAFLRLRIASIQPEAFGKLPATTDNFMFAEFSWFFQQLAAQVKPGSPLAAALLSSEPRDYSSMVLLNMPPPRLAAYDSNNYDTIQGAVSKWGGVALYRIGFNQVDSVMPLLTSMRNTRFFSLFLGLIIAMVVGILTMLSTILIYSLLMVSVETRTFELGVLRMIGMRRLDLVQMVLVNAFLYSVPAWAAGLLFAQILTLAVTSFFGSSLSIDLDPRLAPLAIGLATLLGLLIPVFASIFPIKNALSMNLHDSLDTRHSKTQAVTYRLERADAGGASSVKTSTVLVGFLLLVFGFTIFYFFPLALLSLNIELLLYMFFILLMALLFGVVLLALNLETILEKTMTLFFFFWETHSMRTLIHKNLVAHRLRNRKTTIMYALSIGFIIFLLVNLELQVVGFVYQRMQAQGSRLWLYQAGGGGGGVISLGLLRAVEQAALQGSLPPFAYVYRYAPTAYSFSYSFAETLGRYAKSNIQINAVSPNIFDIADRQFLDVARQNETSGLSPVEQLYTTRGGHGSLLGSSFAQLFRMDTSGSSTSFSSWFSGTGSGGGELDTTFQVSLHADSSGRLPFVFHRLVDAMAFYDNAPIYKLSKFSAAGTGGVASMVVSLPTFFSLAKLDPIQQANYRSIRNLPVQWILFATGSPAQQKDLMKNLQALVTQFDGARLGDLDKQLAPLLQGIDVLNYFFIFTILVAMTMCFFSLTSSMFTNIQEQSKEIGILRSIGTPQGFVVRLFVYEAFVLVMSASLMGVLIGVVVAYTMVIQRAVFTQLPIPFLFPYLQVAAIAAFGIFFALAASYTPAKKIVHEPIVTTLRRLLS